MAVPTAAVWVVGKGQRRVRWKGVETAAVMVYN
jgi:hypothetical protein